jgi:hypothetical protein
MSSFPAGWVDQIFAKLSVTYGRDFVGRWEGLDLGDVKEDWRREMSGFERFPKSIAYALDHLSDKPPTVLEFRAMCRHAPEDDTARLEAPPASKEIREQELAKIRAIRARPKPDPHDWARRIVARAVSGEHVDPMPLAMAREALGIAKGATP